MDGSPPVFPQPGSYQTSAPLAPPLPKDGERASAALKAAGLEVNPKNLWAAVALLAENKAVDQANLAKALGDGAGQPLTTGGPTSAPAKSHLAQLSPSGSPNTPLGKRTVTQSPSSSPLLGTHPIPPSAPSNEISAARKELIDQGVPVNRKNLIAAQILTKNNIPVNAENIAKALEHVGGDNQAPTVVSQPSEAPARSVPQGVTDPSVSLKEKKADKLSSEDAKKCTRLEAERAGHISTIRQLDAELWLQDNKDEVLRAIDNPGKAKHLRVIYMVDGKEYVLVPASGDEAKPFADAAKNSLKGLELPNADILKNMRNLAGEKLKETNKQLKSFGFNIKKSKEKDLFKAPFIAVEQHKGGARISIDRFAGSLAGILPAKLAIWTGDAVEQQDPIINAGSENLPDASELKLADQYLKSMPKRIEPDKHTLFYRPQFGDPYRENFPLANFYIPQKQLVIDGRAWRTTEHYYQAAKYQGMGDVSEQVRNLTAPEDVYTFAQNNKLENPSEWQAISRQVMLKAVRAKAQQDLHFRQKLLDTGQKWLFEDSPKDAFWGVGGREADGGYPGQNQLGALLMQVRDEVKTGKLPVALLDAPKADVSDPYSKEYGRG